LIEAIGAVALSISVTEQSGGCFHIVGVGASAGGLDAFIELFGALPNNTGMAFVVIQHLEPNYESQLAEILARSTKMPVIQAVNGQTVAPNEVYVIPPNAVMLIEGGILRIAPRSQSAKPYYPIDVFFESLAADQGAKAIAIVLSGTASDGAQGVRAIKRACGTTFCQEESSAKYAGMPHNAIATGAADFVLSTVKIAEELARISLNPFLTAPVERLQDPLEETEIDGEFQLILGRLKNATGVDFTPYKQSTIRRRLGRRLAVNHLDTLREYLAYLDCRPAEVHELYRDILISVTSFFREPGMFASLTEVIQQYLQTRPNEEPFRLWVPGCATGEEVYSLAMIASEILQETRRDVSLQVFGTDISDSAIDHARSGIYTEVSTEGISQERLIRFFSKVELGYRIKQSIRDCCVFARHDLTNDPPFSQIDIVSCRNVFIYLSSGLQQKVLPSLHYSLKTGGLLILGSAETVGTRSDLFSVLDNDNKIYRKNAVDVPLNTQRRSNTGAVPTAGELFPDTFVSYPASVDPEIRAARILRDLYAPPGVMINSDLQVLHVHGQTSFYLDRIPPATNTNLLRVVRESLVYPLRKAVDAVLLRKQPVHETGVEVSHQNQTKRIRLSVYPITDNGQNMLVLFEDESKGGGLLLSQEEILEPGSTEHQLESARRELNETNEYLRKIIEQHSVTTEELRAANEEARSTNEELQSTNEELRTAKEQLQSSNEELTTINDELKHSNIELNLTGNDLANILNAATIPVIMVGMDLRLRRFTPAAATLLGLTSHDIGRTLSDVHRSAGLPDLKSMLIETLRTLNVQFQRGKDAHGRWYDVFTRPYRTIDDRIDGGVVTFLDVDDAVRALERAERARNLAEGTLESVQHPLLILDDDFRVLRATAAFFKTFGLSPETTLGQPIDALGDGFWKRPELKQLPQQALVRDAPLRDTEITHDIPQLGTRRLRLVARRTPSLDGHYSVLLAIEDITERQQAAEIQYRRVFESAKDGIIVLESPSGIVLDVNPYFLELSRYPMSDLITRPIHQTPPFMDLEAMRHLVKNVAEHGTVRLDSVPLLTRDHREITLELIANSYRVKDQSRIQINIRDVTEKRRTEDDLRRSNLDLQQFAFAASHDLQEPLRTITSYLQLLKRENEGKFGPETDAYIRFITSAADRMRQLVLDLLGYSQVSRSEMNPDTISMEAALSTVILNLQMAIESTAARITFDHLPVVYADESQIVRLLQNLITNSIKYRGKAPPHIHLSAKESGSEWLFSVKDNGLGLDMRYADHIFTVFKRLHGQEYPGTGIGLAICKRIVDRHEGRIWVESKLGEGSTFSFTLPRFKVA
jgi:two-component system CheB/CheR fusion protein